MRIRFRPRLALLPPGINWFSVSWSSRKPKPRPKPRPRPRRTK